MKILKIGLLAACVFCIAGAKAQGIKFEEDLSWNEIKAKAQKEKKNIFLDIFTTWCGPCKWMDQNTYRAKEVGDFMNDHFVSVRVQMDSTAKDNEMVKLWYQTAKNMAAYFQVGAYPTLLFVSESGIPLYKTEGLLKSDDFLKSAALALDTNNSYLGKHKQYLEGWRESNFVLELTREARRLGQFNEAEKIAASYIVTIPKDKLFTSDHLWMMYENTKTSKDRGFGIFLTQADKVHDVDANLAVAYLNALVDGIIYQENVQPFVKSLKGKPDWVKIKSNLKKYGSRGDEQFIKAEYAVAGEKADPFFTSEIKPLLLKNASWETVIGHIKSLKRGKGEERLVGTSIIAYLTMLGDGREKDFNKFFSAATYYEKNFSVLLSAGALNDWSWVTFSSTNDKNQLEKALTWSRLSLEKAPGNSGYTDTYANILYKLGRTQEAIQFEEKALTIDPRNFEFKTTLEKMRRGEPTWAITN